MKPDNSNIVRVTITLRKDIAATLRKEHAYMVSRSSHSVSFSECMDKLLRKVVTPIKQKSKTRKYKKRGKKV